MKNLIYLCAMSLVLVFGSCRSAEKLLDQGRYDELLTLAERKLAGKKVNKEKYVVAAETAFEKVTARDMARIERLKSSGRSQDWEAIVSIAKRIEKRQEKLTPFLPLVSDNGYKAEFSFMKVHEILEYANAQVVDALYRESQVHLRLARNGDKYEARSAYDKLTEIIDIRGDYRDVIALRRSARELGTTKVLVEIDDQMHQFVPRYVRIELEESVRQLHNTFWTEYITSESLADEADLVARIVVRDLDISPDIVNREEVARKKSIEDGWTYVLDERGNVAKDSLGNDIKVPRFIDVSAVVVRTHLEKVAELRTRMEILDSQSGQVLESWPIHLESRFYHRAQSFYGDQRALKNDDKLQIALVPFPGNDALALEVIDLFREALPREMRKSRSWARAGGNGAFIERVRDPVLKDSIHRQIMDNLINDRGGDDLDRVQFAMVSWDTTLQGKTLKHWCEREGMELTIANGAEMVIRAQLNGGCTCIFHAMEEDDVKRIMQHPYTAVATDGRLTKLGERFVHPRNYGTFPRVLGKYVREEGILSLEEAIRKMTSLPADRLGLANRGRLQEGTKADLVIFDPGTVHEVGDFVKPHAYPVGINYVMVNGKVVLENGTFHQVLPGQVLRKK